MSLSLSDWVVGGEISNRNNYAVHGWLRLRDHERPLLLQLTGNCSSDLAGKHIRFSARSGEFQQKLALHREQSGDHEFNALDLPKLAWQQVGPTGVITASRKVRVSTCSPEELQARYRLDEPPPFQWKRSLYLEWFSQNGRLVVELIDPIIETVTDAEEQEREGEGEAELDTEDLLSFLRPSVDESPDESEFDSEEDSEEGQSAEDDPYQLIPEELKHQLDSEFKDPAGSLGEDEDGSNTLRELELLDDLIETSDGEPIGALFDSPVKFPLPDQLNDEEVEQALKRLLANLAQFGICLDLCEHFTVRDAYRLLLERICTEEHAYPELRDTQWVQHFMTSEFCEQCEAEIAREMDRDSKRSGRFPEGDAPTGDSEPGTDPEVPF